MIQIHLILLKNLFWLGSMPYKQIDDLNSKKLMPLEASLVQYDLEYTRWKEDRDQERTPPGSFVRSSINQLLILLRLLRIALIFQRRKKLEDLGTDQENKDPFKEWL